MRATVYSLLSCSLPFFGGGGELDCEACGDFSFVTRDRTHAPCIGRKSLNHKTTKEVPPDGLIFFILFIFNWRIIALQCCVGLCHTSTWISHRYTHVPSLLNLPPTSHPSSCHRAPVWAPCVIRQIPTGCFTRGRVCVSGLLSQFVPPLFPTEDWLLTSPPLTDDPIHPLPKTFPCVPVAHLPYAFFFLKKLYCHIVNLQCCVSFWYAGKWISSWGFFFFFWLSPNVTLMLTLS